MSSANMSAFGQQGKILSICCCTGELLDFLNVIITVMPLSSSFHQLLVRPTHSKQCKTTWAYQCSFSLNQDMVQPVLSHSTVSAFTGLLLFTAIYCYSLHSNAARQCQQHSQQNKHCQITPATSPYLSIQSLHVLISCTAKNRQVASISSALWSLKPSSVV